MERLTQPLWGGARSRAGHAGTPSVGSMAARVFPVTHVGHGNVRLGGTYPSRGGVLPQDRFRTPTHGSNARKYVVHEEHMLGGAHSTYVPMAMLHLENSVPGKYMSVAGLYKSRLHHGAVCTLAHKGWAASEVSGH